MIQGLRDVVGIDEVVRRCEAALAGAAALGLPRHPLGRFEQYLHLLREAASFAYPRPFPWKDDEAKRRLFFEATSQVQQLLDAEAVWGSLTPDARKKKLDIVLSGSALPPKGKGRPDRPRNTLFEFAVARSLQHKGFEVTLTDSAEDVRARFPGLPPFLVECKRPTHAGSLGRVVTKSRRQLRERCD
jgi:hypothetical protein